MIIVTAILKKHFQKLEIKFVFFLLSLSNYAIGLLKIIGLLAFIVLILFVSFFSLFV